jgi:hypothetical protein
LNENVEIVLKRLKIHYSELALWPNPVVPAGWEAEVRGWLDQKFKFKKKERG